MLPIESVNHVGIRVTNKQTSIDFYALLGFQILNDAGFEKGHPVIMKHPNEDVPGRTRDSDNRFILLRRLVRSLNT